MLKASERLLNLNLTQKSPFKTGFLFLSIKKNNN